MRFHRLAARNQVCPQRGNNATIEAGPAETGEPIVYPRTTGSFKFSSVDQLTWLWVATAYACFKGEKKGLFAGSLPQKKKCVPLLQRCLTTTVPTAWLLRELPGSGHSVKWETGLFHRKSLLYFEACFLPLLIEFR